MIARAHRQTPIETRNCLLGFWIQYSKWAKIKRRHKQATDLEIVLNEGRNREIRRLLAQLGHKVLFLKRTAIGPLRLGKLPVGASRRLTNTELQQLKSCTNPASSTSRRKSRTRRPSKGSPRS